MVKRAGAVILAIGSFIALGRSKALNLHAEERIIYYNGPN
jgi:hypothetical protein